METFIFNLEELANSFGGVVFGEYREDRNLERAQSYLRTLNYEHLVGEAKRAHHLSRSTRNSALDLKFPDYKNPKIKYMMKPSEYLQIVHQEISNLLHKKQLCKPCD